MNQRHESALIEAEPLERTPIDDLIDRLQLGEVITGGITGYEPFGLSDPLALGLGELASAEITDFLEESGLVGDLEDVGVVTEDDDGEELETYGDTLAFGKEDLAILVIDRVSFKMGGIVYTLQDRAPEPKRTNKSKK